MAEPQSARVMTAPHTHAHTALICAQFNEVRRHHVTRAEARRSIPLDHNKKTTARASFWMDGSGPPPARSPPEGLTHVVGGPACTGTPGPLAVRTPRARRRAALSTCGPESPEGVQLARPLHQVASLIEEEIGRKVFVLVAGQEGLDDDRAREAERHQPLDGTLVLLVKLRIHRVHTATAARHRAEHLLHHHRVDAELLHHLPRERSSEVIISGHQRSSAVISGHHRVDPELLHHLRVLHRLLDLGQLHQLREHLRVLQQPLEHLRVLLDHLL